MNSKSLRLAIVIISLGILLAVASTFITGVLKSPVIKEHDFEYSVTYKLNGEIKTIEGIYKCRFDGHSGASNPIDRKYSEEYIVDGVTTISRTHTIAQADGMELYIVVLFSNGYLMGDTKSSDYAPFLNDPVIEALDSEGNGYDEEALPEIFDAEIISWEYPEPIENSFVFSGFSVLYYNSMFAMLLIGLLVIVACLVFVKKDEAVSYKDLDKLSVVLNYLLVIAGIPFVTVLVLLMQIVMDCGGLGYQIFLCLPAVAAFTVAASIVLRRLGYTKPGFFIQLVAPVIFFLDVIFG